MLVSQVGLDLIKSFEGYSPTVYICIAGYPTIGYGHVVRKGEQFDTLNVAAAEELLAKDLNTFETAVIRLTSRQLAQHQFDALVSFTYNLGAAAYQRSTLRQCVNMGHDDMVPEQFLRWNRAGGMVRAGLTRRRKAEATLYQEAEDVGTD